MTFKDKLVFFPDLEQELNDFGLVFWHGCVNFIRNVHRVILGKNCV